MSSRCARVCVCVCGISVGVGAQSDCGCCEIRNAKKEKGYAGAKGFYPRWVIRIIMKGSYKTQNQIQN